MDSHATRGEMPPLPDGGVHVSRERGGALWWVASLIAFWRDDVDPVRFPEGRMTHCAIAFGANSRPDAEAYATARCRDFWPDADRIETAISRLTFIGDGAPI